MSRCRVRVKNRLCKHSARLRGKCTVHYIKSRSYKGKDKNIRRKGNKK